MARPKTSNYNSKSNFRYNPECGRPEIHQRGPEIQAFGTIAKLPIALGEKVMPGER